MSTEYRRGIPSVAYVEAATRLGLLWRAEERPQLAWCFVARDNEITSAYGHINAVETHHRTSIYRWETEQSYRPIRADGTPVDWEVLDAEVVRVAQPATVTPTASIVPTTQPQGFRADLWRRTCRHFISADEDRVSSRHLGDVETIERRGCLFRDDDGWQWLEDEGPTRTDILTRWAVYQELKPLYDLVDGAQGEVAMPRDVEAEWYRAAQRPWTRPVDNWLLARDSTGLMIKNRYNMATWQPDEAGHGTPLRNFAAVLDAVAEQRVAARQGQATVEQPRLTFRNVDRLTTMADTVTLPVDPSSPRIASGALLMQTPQGVRPATAPEPRSFADVRPDRHGWRWWRLFGSGCGQGGTLIEADRASGWRVKSNGMYMFDWNVPNSSDADRTVIPTDEQGNPVSWESVGRGSMPTTGRTETLIYVHTDGTPINAETVRAVKPAPLPRFTADELDDVDHSATTTQDSATLKRGKLPTVEAISKYREVMAKRNGTVADAVKASGIDCEVAQYVLERWAGGLDDASLRDLIACVRYSSICTVAEVCAIRSRWGERRPTLDTSEPVDTEAQRQRAEAAERKARMTALQAQLAKERAARVAEPTEELSRFALLEVDEAADPARSIEAWKTQRARNVVRPIAIPASQPTSAPRRKAFEVVDAQAEGLSGTAALAVLLGRAMNGGC